MSEKFIYKNKELDYIFKIDKKEDIKNNLKKLVNIIDNNNINIKLKEDKIKYKINYNEIYENFENIEEDNSDSKYLIGGESSEENDYEYDNENYWEEECKDYNKIPHLMTKRDRIIAIGDIHGDWKLTLKCLKLAGVLNKDCTDENNAEWIGGNTVVVQIGDQIDRCRPLVGKKCKEKFQKEEMKIDEDSDVRIYEIFTLLDSKALKNKDKNGKDDPGRVISLLGNHEILNSQKKMSYVSAKGLACYGIDCKNEDLKEEELEEMIIKGEKEEGRILSQEIKCLYLWMYKIISNSNR